MRTLIFAMAFAAAVTPLSVIPAAASDKTDVMATVNQWNNDFDKGDMKAFVAACTPRAIIIDEFPPYVWQGATACTDWMNDDALNKQNDTTGGVFSFGKPWRVSVTGDRAYVVLPAKYTDKKKGKKVVQHDVWGVWTVTLQKVGAGWGITGSAWAQH